MLKLLWKMMVGGGGKSAMLDTMLATHDAKVRQVPDFVEPPAQAPPRHSFTSSIPPEQLWVNDITWRQRRVMLPVMIPLMRAMNKSARLYERPLKSPKTELPEALRPELEALLREHGAADVGYTRVEDSDLFRDLGVPHRNVIVYTVAMDKDALDTAPSFECFIEVAKGYLKLARIGNEVSRFLRKHGVAAYPGTALGGLSDYCRLAERAGLGRIGYHGCLITPSEGAIVRINTVYTSADNLAASAASNPTEAVEDHTAWIRDFCAMCHKCIKKCPPKALHAEPTVLDNGRIECLDTTACLDYFASHHGCAVCIDVCPFTQAGYSRIERSFKGHPDAPTFDLVAMLKTA